MVAKGHLELFWVGSGVGWGGVPVTVLVTTDGRGCATLMGASEVTSETKGWGGERLCDFDGGF